MSIVENQMLARPYAEAAFRFAKAEQTLPSWQAFLAAYAQLFAEPSLQTYLHNPFVDQLELIKILAEHLKDILPPTQMNFLKLLAEKRRLTNLTSISEVFNQQVDRDAGVLRVIAESAFEIDPTTLVKIQQQLAAHFKQNIAIQSQNNPALIGGVKIYIGDKVFDRTVQAELGELYQSLI